MENRTDLLEGLNPRQAEAVKHFTGPLLILAGAGTGKTRVITHRIAYIIGKLGVTPGQVLALTFTNKAADEMRERTVSLVGDRARGVMLSTFHSFCNYVLRRNIGRLGNYASNYSIYDEADARSCIKEILKACELPQNGPFAPGRIASAISRAKNFGAPEECVGRSDDLANYFLKIYELYEKRLDDNNALDFDDLILKALRLFRDHDDVRERFRRRFPFILVDEYQDTNHVQYELLRELSPPDGNITVVGDLDQSIYSWRGADVGNMISFERDFDNVVVVALEQNYRSQQRILDAANALITFNPAPREKRLWSELGEGEPVHLYQAWDDRDEALFIAREIDYLVSEGYRLDDIAVLFRARSQSRVLEDVFIKAGVPYRLINATAFYDRKEIKDITAYLRVIENPRDMVSFRRIANEPRRGIGPKSVERIEDAVREYGSLCGLPDDIKELPKGFPAKALPLIRLMKSLHKSRDSMPVTELIRKTVDETGYYENMMHSDRQEGINRTENIDEFISVAAEYERKVVKPGLEGFLSQVSLSSDVDMEDFGEGSVRMLTLHSAKGLEFPVVFIVGVEEGMLPHRTALEDRNGEPEERRLCYVGITRAREVLYMSACRQRLQYGTPASNSISRFVEEIGKEHFEVISSPRGGPASGESFFDDEDNGVSRDEDGFIVERVELPDDDVRWSGRRFRAGDRIEHEELGCGKVVSLRDDEICVSFPGRGVWWLSLESAPIRKL